MIILDTNVLSEMIAPQPSPVVVNWLNEQPRNSLFLTTITQAELLYGVERLPAGKRRTGISVAVEAMLAIDFSGRILSFDADAARFYAKIVAVRENSGRPISQPDALIAAIARSHRARVATRNVRDFDECDIHLTNPWMPSR